MFKIFFLSEVRYALKRPLVYIMFGLMALLTFAATASDKVSIGGSVGNVLKNAPHIITIYTSVLSVFGLLIATAFFNNAALRDYKNNFNEILFSTPLSKFGYFFGRFFAALFISTLPLFGVYFGVITGSLIAPMLGWVDADRFGSFYVETFISTYFLFILPNMFFAGSIIFALASKWKDTVISFIGSILIFIGYSLSISLLSDLDNENLAALIDTFGIGTYQLEAKYYTSVEKNVLNPQFSGLLLWNRLLWFAVGALILFTSYLAFSFKIPAKKSKVKKSAQRNTLPVMSLPVLHPTFQLSAKWKQFKSFFQLNFYSITKSITFKILFLFSAVMLITSLMQGYEYYGLQSYPVTYKILDTISSSGLFLLIVMVFFSGELIWRDRDVKINEVIDATPHNSIVAISAKAISLICIGFLMQLFYILCGITYQLATGYTTIEIEVYLLDLLYNSLPNIIIWSGIFIGTQVIVNNKYLGYFIAITLIVFLGILLSIFDIQSNMLNIAAVPSMKYSDMNGFGPALTGVLWFNFYWILVALIFLLLSAILWNRGVSSNLKNRIVHAGKNASGTLKIILAVVFVGWCMVAGFIYYNTQLLNTYWTGDEIEELKADYEKTYKKYENIPMPKIHDIKNVIDIYPYKRDFSVKSKMLLVNEANVPLEAIHYTLNPDLDIKINIPESNLVLNDSVLKYQIYELNRALQPQDSIYISINTSYTSQGFENETSNTEIIMNGTFLNNMELLPLLGYQPFYELSDKNARKKYDLEPKERMPKLQANCTEACMQNYLSQGSADFINIENTVSTANDQLAIAPGSLIKQWNEGDRSYFTYKVDHPSQNFYSVVSAKYKVKKRKWKDVDLEVYYDEKHEVNVDMMLDAVENSLSYYTENFGPYYHKQARIIEFPRYANFAQAFPGTMPYSESVGFIINLEDESGNNIIDAVVAHEMGHQWWAHQLIGANMQGGTLLSESFSEYASLMVMKKTAATKMKMREFLKYNHDRYLRGRSQEISKEMPLMKIENQDYIHYGKGSVVMYALQDYIGEEKINSALHEFLEAYKYRKPPYPTSLNFMEYLKPQVPDSLNYVLKDWFETITLYDNRIKEAKYLKLANGKYQIEMEIDSRKLAVDSIGNESPLPLNDWIDVGAFADEDEEKLIFEKRIRINKNQTNLKFEIDTIPAKLAIDPRHILIDKVYKDNVKTAEEVTKG